MQTLQTAFKIRILSCGAPKCQESRTHDDLPRAREPPTPRYQPRMGEGRRSANLADNERDQELTHEHIDTEQGVALHETCHQVPDGYWQRQGRDGEKAVQNKPEPRVLFQSPSEGDRGQGRRGGEEGEESREIGELFEGLVSGRLVDDYDCVTGVQEGHGGAVVKGRGSGCGRGSRGAEHGSARNRNRERDDIVLDTSSRATRSLQEGEEDDDDSLSFLSPSRQERDYSEIVLASCTPTSPVQQTLSLSLSLCLSSIYFCTICPFLVFPAIHAIIICSSHRLPPLILPSSSPLSPSALSWVYQAVDTLSGAYIESGHEPKTPKTRPRKQPVSSNVRGRETGTGSHGLDSLHQVADRDAANRRSAQGGLSNRRGEANCGDSHERNTLASPTDDVAHNAPELNAFVPTTSQSHMSSAASLDMSPVTTHSFSSTCTLTSSSSSFSATSVGASPTIPQAVTPVRSRLQALGFPTSALRGRLDFSKSPAPFSTPPTKKISFHLSPKEKVAVEVGGVLSADGLVGNADSGQKEVGSGEEEDWEADAQIAAECLGTPRTPRGRRGIMCQMAEEGFKTAVKQAVHSSAGFMTPLTPKRTARNPATAPITIPKTPMSAVAFRRRRAELVQQVVCELNGTVFEGCLPADLEICWSNLFSKTAGMTKFRMLKPVAGDALDVSHDDGQVASVASDARPPLRAAWKEHRSRDESGDGGRQQMRGRRGEGGTGDTGLEGAEILTASIELSSKIVDNADRLRCTLAHELCHVAQWVVNREAKPPHGDAFRLWANRVEEYDPSLKVSPAFLRASLSPTPSPSPPPTLRPLLPSPRSIVHALTHANAGDDMPHV
jgi:hypothetical protein